MGCQQVREKQEQTKSKVFIQESGIRNSHPLIHQQVCIENLENIRNQEDLAKVIIKKLISQNELKLSCKLRKKSEDLYDQGKYPEALKVQKRVLVLQRQNSMDNSDLAKTLLNIGEMEIKMRNFENSFKYFRELLDLNRFKDQKSIHIKALNSINKAAEELLQQGKLEKALLFKKEVLNYTIYFFGEEHQNFTEKVDILRQEIRQYEQIFQEILLLQSNHELIDPEYFQDQDKECMICCKEFSYYQLSQNSQPSEEIQQNISLQVSNQQLQKYNITRLRCNHIFHSDCINQWLLKQQNCPYCRSHISENLDEQVYQLGEDQEDIIQEPESL